MRMLADDLADQTKIVKCQSAEVHARALFDCCGSRARSMAGGVCGWCVVARSWQGRIISCCPRQEPPTPWIESRKDGRSWSDALPT